jgi:hypothetical protein
MFCKNCGVSRRIFRNIDWNGLSPRSFTRQFVLKLEMVSATLSKIFTGLA